MEKVRTTVYINRAMWDMAKARGMNLSKEFNEFLNSYLSSPNISDLSETIKKKELELNALKQKEKKLVEEKKRVQELKTLKEKEEVFEKLVKQFHFNKSSGKPIKEIVDEVQTLFELDRARALHFLERGYM
jgi:beta-phosphoglucomutase-like phosphatase (HAD superfamily)